MFSISQNIGTFINTFYIKIQELYIFMNPTSCPYNPNHKFAESKYFWHINRCKDRLKVMHKYANCTYNQLHIVLKEDIETHQLICSDRSIYMQARDNLKNVLEKCLSKQVKVKQQEKKQENSCSFESGSIIDKTRCIKKQQQQEQFREALQPITPEQTKQSKRDRQLEKEHDEAKTLQQCQECLKILEILQCEQKLSRAHKELKKYLKANEKLNRMINLSN